MTPEEKAQQMVGDPAWSFSSNPVKAISHATTNAAEAYDGRRDYAQARFWTSVGLVLCQAAGLERGASLGELAATLGIADPPTI